VIGDDIGASDEEWLAACDEALAVLSDSLIWRLPEPSWDHVVAALVEIAEAVEASSLDDLWRGIASLELCGPLRISTRLGDTPQLPAPKPVLERVAELTTVLRPEDGRKDDDESGTRANRAG
jgi:hypothetical protein